MYTMQTISSGWHTQCVPTTTGTPGGSGLGMIHSKKKSQQAEGY